MPLPKHPKIRKTAKTLGIVYLGGRLIFGGILLTKAAHKAGNLTGKTHVEQYMKTARTKTARHPPIKIPLTVQEELAFRNKTARFGEIYFYNGKTIKRFNLNITDIKRISLCLEDKQVNEMNQIIKNLKNRLINQEETINIKINLKKGERYSLDKHLSSLSLFELNSLLLTSEREALKKIVHTIPSEILKQIDLRYNITDHVTRSAIYYLAIIALVELSLKTKRVIQNRRNKKK